MSYMQREQKGVGLTKIRALRKLLNNAETFYTITSKRLLALPSVRVDSRVLPLLEQDLPPANPLHSERPSALLLAPHRLCTIAHVQTKITCWLCGRGQYLNFDLMQKKTRSRYVYGGSMSHGMLTALPPPCQC